MLYRVVQKVISKFHMWVSQIMKSKIFIGTGGRKRNYDGAIVSFPWRNKNNKHNSVKGTLIL